MQLNSIPEPVRLENERTPAPFPQSGDNFVTVTSVHDKQDALALLEALEFVNDMQLMLAEFHRINKPEKRTDTVELGLSAGAEAAEEVR